MDVLYIEVELKVLVILFKIQLFSREKREKNLNKKLTHACKNDEWVDSLLVLSWKLHYWDK